MILKIEHLGIAIATDDGDTAEMFSRLLNRKPYKKEEVESEGVRTTFYDLDGSKIELLNSIKEGSPVERFLEKKGQAIHHIALLVDDIRSEMARLKEEGFVLLNDEPKKGADNKLICFLHPKSTGGILIELCQETMAE